MLVAVVCGCVVWPRVASPLFACGLSNASAHSRVAVEKNSLIVGVFDSIVGLARCQCSRAGVEGLKS